MLSHLSEAGSQGLLFLLRTWMHCFTFCRMSERGALFINILILTSTTLIFTKAIGLLKNALLLAQST